MTLFTWTKRALRITNPPMYSRCSFERVAHAVGELYGDRNDVIEDALITAYEPPEEARSVSVGLDRVSMPMIEPRARPPGRQKKGAPKNPITVAWRMRSEERRVGKEC